MFAIDGEDFLGVTRAGRLGFLAELLVFDLELNCRVSIGFVVDGRASPAGRKTNDNVPLSCATAKA